MSARTKPKSKRFLQCTKFTYIILIEIDNKIAFFFILIILGIRIFENVNVGRNYPGYPLHTVQTRKLAQLSRSKT